MQTTNLNRFLRVCELRENNTIDGSKVYAPICGLYANVKEDSSSESFDSTRGNQNSKLNFTVTVRDTKTAQIKITPDKYIFYRGKYCKIKSQLISIDDGWLKFQAEMEY